MVFAEIPTAPVLCFTWILSAQIGKASIDDFSARGMVTESTDPVSEVTFYSIDLSGVVGVSHLLSPRKPFPRDQREIFHLYNPLLNLGICLKRINRYSIEEMSSPIIRLFEVNDKTP